MNEPTTILGVPVLDAAPKGAIPISGPYRPGREDWMLARCLCDFLRERGHVVLVWEIGTTRGHSVPFRGLSIWRRVN